MKRLKYSASINDEALPETTDPDFDFEYVDIGGINAVLAAPHVLTRKTH